ncbi:uroporphyrinogen-III synthase [uncultured Rikenella sp.]|uniref:uroporphyrinogen-III synthase n=1 Tax=uncultured Rikenella sp. TaxID=368003 RepID=UPI0026181810|nr:uroporphyrinogen-III synthase [uncultured Rikenella sp.]
MAKTQKVKRILIAQPAPSSDKSPFSELVSKHKLEVDFRPFIAVEGVTPKEFRAQRVDVLAHTAVIFTSRKTIDNFFELCEACRIQVPEDMKYFCVTEAIALYLQKYIVYRKRKIFYGTTTFADLMEVVAKHKEERFLVALSDPYKPEIEALLGKTGVKYTKIILAHTVTADLSDISIVDYDLVACYSSADVRALRERFEVLPEGMIVATLGNATAREALVGGLKVDIVAPTPRFPSLTMAIDKYVAAINSGGSVEGFGMTAEDLGGEAASKGGASTGTKKGKAATKVSASSGSGSSRRSVAATTGK